MALVEILRKLEAQPYHCPVGRIMFQKLVYAATREGLPTGLGYRKCSFGPFSSKLQQVQTQLVKRNLLPEEPLGRMFRVRVGANYARVRAEFEAAFAPWTHIIDKTADLFQRVDTNQAEILATVMFAADSLENSLRRVPAEGEILAAVLDWKQRRDPPLKKEEVAAAIRNLAMLRWLSVTYDPDLPLPAEELL
ncbi:MAG: hypothetical protein HYV26_02395 [Candidatus Hydrogenedentes bacterium]|nr:hypothetical protein [Candidatus Hydrogenedentota bacterium]